MWLESFRIMGTGELDPLMELIKIVICPPKKQKQCLGCTWMMETLHEARRDQLEMRDDALCTKLLLYSILYCETHLTWSRGATRDRVWSLFCGRKFLKINYKACSISRLNLELRREQRLVSTGLIGHWTFMRW